MVLRPYHLIFMGWSGKFAGIISWYEKFLVYVRVSHVLCRGMGDILYIESCERILAITPLRYCHHYHYHSAPPLPLLLLSLRFAIAIIIIITPLRHCHYHYYYFASLLPSLLLLLRFAIIIIIIIIIIAI